MFAPAVFSPSVAVALGGSAGALARFALDRGVIDGVDPNLAILLAVNLLGAFVLGLVTGHGIPALGDAWRGGITTGFLGSFTTYSAITTVWLSLTLEGSVVAGVAYLVGSLIAGVVTAWGGLEIGRWWRDTTTADPAGGAR